MGTLLEFLADLFLDSLSLGRRVILLVCGMAVLVGIVLLLVMPADDETASSATGLGLIIVGFVGIVIYVGAGWLWGHKE